MGSTERIRNVAKRVAKWARAGHQMVVVPSAMSGETNRLLGPGQGTGARASPATRYDRELDMLASTGEQASSALLAIALQAEGMQSVSYAGWQVPIRTNSAYTKARIESIDDERVRADLAAGKVVIITGFQGVDDAGHITTLGRGGSDTSAVAVAAAMKAARMPDLHRRRRRLHHRPARRARGAPPAHRELRGDAGDGVAWAPRCCRSARWNSPASTRCRCACCRASRPGTSTSTKKPRPAR